MEKARAEIVLIPKVMRQSPSVANYVTMRSITKRKKSEMQSDVQKIADRYEHIVYWSDKDRCYIGRCPELFLGGVHGEDINAVFRGIAASGCGERNSPSGARLPAGATPHRCGSVVRRSRTVTIGGEANHADTRSPTRPNVLP